VDLPDAAYLPPDYVEAEDVRLEAYRRLSAVRTQPEVEDVRSEWQDRFGLLPAPATALLEVALLRVECLRLGVEDLAVSVPRFASEGAGPRGGPGGRAVAKLSPVILPTSAEVRLRRLAPGATFLAEAHRLTIPIAPDTATGGYAPALVALLRELVPAD
jgi:transcription-repair coupling factor (superfamily II helicase)